MIETRKFSFVGRSFSIGSLSQSRHEGCCFSFLDKWNHWTIFFIAAGGFADVAFELSGHVVLRRWFPPSQRYKGMAGSC